MPQNSVNSIAQTPDGYLWIATNDGVARFDGVRFRIFKKSNTPELPTNRIASVHTDDVGRLWIFPESGGDMILHQDGIFLKFEKERDLGAKPIVDIFAEGGNTILAAGDIEFVWDGTDLTSRERIGRKLEIGVDNKTATVWIDGGSTHYAIHQGKVTAYPASERPQMTSLWLAPVSVPRVDGAIWFFHWVGKKLLLSRFKDGRLAITSINRPNASGMGKDRDGNLWVLDRYFGAFRIDVQAMSADDISSLELAPVDTGHVLTTDAMMAIFSDRNQNLWIGGTKGLLLLNDNQVVETLNKQSGLPGENVYAITEDEDGYIWFGAWNVHLLRYKDGEILPTIQYFVTALFADPDVGLLVAAGNSLWRWHDGRLIRFPLKGFDPLPLGEVSFVTRDRAGNLLVGGAYGLLRHDGQSGKLFRTDEGLPSYGVTSFLETRGGEIWLGTTGGVARLDGDRFQAFTKNDGMSGDFVRSLYEDGEGTLWIGTYDSGITRFKDGKFSPITTRDGLFSDGVFCFLEDDAGWFWMNSNQGIHRSKRSDLNDFADGKTTFVNSVSYGVQDGLLNVEGNGGKQPAGLKASDGRFWFPTAGGVAIVDPARARRNDAPPATLIEDVVVDQKVQPTDSEYSLQPGQSALAISYTAINFRRPEQIRFRYQLQGLDDTWTEAGTRRTAYFTHLPYGEYTFLVAASNNDGDWNQIASALKVTVIPPFYRTTWFYFLSGLLIVGIGVSIYLFRVNQLKSAERDRAEFTRQLIESQEHERSRIAIELHDSLGQSLAVIRNRALLGLRTPDNNPRLVEQMSEIRDASAEALEETRVIAHNLHPYQLEHLGLTMALKSLVRTVQSSSELALTDDIREVDTHIPADAAINVYRIAQECLSNIIKHSGATRANIDLHQDSQGLSLRVSDNGKGFDPSVKASGLGLKGIRERAKMLGTDVKVDTAPGSGTTIAVSFETPSNGNERTNARNDRGRSSDI